MDAPKVADVPLPIQFFSHDCETRCLLEIESTWRYKISRRKEVGELCTDVKINLRQNLHKITRFTGVQEQVCSLNLKLTIIEIDDNAILDVRRDIVANGVKNFVQTLFDDHPVQRTREENFLVLR
jgi:hypothetical protein